MRFFFQRQYRSRFFSLLIKKRVGVSVFFFVNGFISASWASRLPELQDHFGINDAQLGTILFIAALGAISAMPFVGWLSHTFTSQKITHLTGVLYAISSSLIMLSDNTFYLGVFFFTMGMTAGALDVSMNAQAVFVEKLWKKSIMSSFHGVFSVGMAIGAGFGILFASAGIVLFYHLLTVAIASGLLNLWAGFHLVSDKKHYSGLNNEKSHLAPPKLSLPNRAILPLGIIAFCCMLGESSMMDWSAIYMNKIVQESKVASAFAYGAFASFMTLGRFVGDTLSEKAGKKKFLLFNSFLSIVGLAIPLLFPFFSASILGFSLIGFGLSNIVPLIYSESSNVPGTSVSNGIAMVTTIGYGGFFVGPPVIGYLSELFDLRVGLGFPLLLLVTMLIVLIKTPFKK